MTATPNKNLTLPTVSGDSGSWGPEINNGVITALDNILGGIDSISLGSANYTLNATEAQNLVLKLSGGLSDNVTVFSPIIGFCIVENNTVGNYTVTWQANFGAGNVGSGIVLGQGSRSFLVSDTVVGARRADTSVLPSGTNLPFYNASAPLGWTQVASYNDYAMRIVSGTGGGSSAGSGFLGGSVDGHALSIAEMPSHNHNVVDPGHTHPYTTDDHTVTGNGGSGGAWMVSPTTQNTGSSTTGISIANAGGGSAHTHTLTGLSMLNFILCTKQ